MDEHFCITDGVHLVKNPYYIASQLLHIVVIFWTLYGCIIAHGLVFIVFESQHLITAWAAKKPCDVFQSPKFCLMVRFALHLTCNCFVMLQLGLCVERTIATVYPGSYESSRSCQGKTICVLAIFASLIGASLTDLSSKNSEALSSCLNNHKDNWMAVDISNYFLTAVNLLTFFWACTLLFINKIYKKRLDGNLSNRYQVRENLASTRLIMILGWMQFVIYAIHVSCNIARRASKDHMSTVLYRALASIGYMLTYYTFLTPLITVLLIGKERRTKLMSLRENLQQTSTKGAAGQNAYFNAYEKRWQ
ncbi:hypothetical protein Y032_0052g2254 [Ancylostoma ceylanicum]|uniref:G-protein coupled receptors family 1 profile domain-containing protein n=1 Tax=Ancylostoma ceylanicum TaxID=53326 RepID=A0A016U8I2_9BILA|nr:hypothetical protein Y032_0052g2254 [Ancylostoma ceylanicum]